MMASSVGGMVRGILTEHPGATTEEIMKRLAEMNVPASRAYVQRIAKQWKEAPE